MSDSSSNTIHFDMGSAVQCVRLTPEEVIRTPITRHLYAFFLHQRHDGSPISEKLQIYELCLRLRKVIKAFEDRVDDIMEVDTTNFHQILADIVVRHRGIINRELALTIRDTELECFNLLMSSDETIEFINELAHTFNPRTEN